MPHKRVPPSSTLCSTPDEGPGRESGSLFAKSLQVQFLSEREIQHGDSQALIEFLQTDDASAREAEGIAIGMSSCGELGERHRFVSRGVKRTLQPDGEVVQFQPRTGWNADGTYGVDLWRVEERHQHVPKRPGRRRRTCRA